MRRIASGIGVAAFAALLALYYWLGLTSLMGHVGDDVVYLTVAKAIATGQGYRDIYLPGAPPHVSYPPVYPLALSVVWWFWPAFPANLLAFKALNIGFALAAIGLTYALAARVYGLPKWQAGLAALMLAFSGFIPDACDLTMSEMLFATLLLAVLYGIERLADEPAAERPWAPPAIAALAVLTMMTRGIGLGVIAAAVAWLFARGQRRLALLTGAWAAAFLMPWVLYVRAARAEAVQFDYLSWTVANTGGLDPALLLEMVATHVPRVLSRSIPLVVAPSLLNPRIDAVLGSFGTGVALLAVTAVVLAGLVRLARPRVRLVHVVLLAYFAIILPFPWDPSRYVAALTPILLIAFVRGATWPAEASAARATIGPAWRASAVLVTAVALVVGLGGMKRAAAFMRRDTFHDAMMRDQDRLTLAETRAIAAWAPNHLPANALWLSHRAPMWFLLTGHKGVSYGDGALPSDSKRALWRAMPTYAIHSRKQPYGWTFQALLAAHPDKAELVYRSPAGVYEVYRLSQDW